jgi:hypothetical protein
MNLCRFDFNHSDPSALADGEVLIVTTSFADSDVFFGVAESKDDFF